MPNRSSDEQRLLEKAGRYLPGGNSGNLHFNPEQDFLVAGGKGSRVWDVSGNEYVDWLMGSGPMLLGHAHAHVVEAVVKTVQQGSTFFANNDKAVCWPSSWWKPSPAPIRSASPPAAPTPVSRPCASAVPSPARKRC